jgi:hypothetical protein
MSNNDQDATETIPDVSEYAWALVSCDGYCFGASDNPKAAWSPYWYPCIDDGRHSDWWITPLRNVPTHLLDMDSAYSHDGKSPSDGYDHWGLLLTYAETRTDERTGQDIMFGRRLSDGQLYGEWDADEEEDAADEADEADDETEDDDQTKAPALFRTTVVIYTRYNTSRMDFDVLAREADRGDAFMSSMSCEYVPDPWDSDAHPPDRDFFWQDDEDGEDDAGDEEGGA